MDTHAPKTHLSQALGLSTEEQKARYDALAKELLGDKQVLAHIMQGAVAEFRDMEIPDIVPVSYTHLTLPTILLV